MGRHMAAWNILQKMFCFAYWFSQFGSCFACGSNIVANVSCVRDLGVLTDSNLSFAEHISHIVAKAHARACFIHNFFLSRDTSTLVRAYTNLCPPTVGILFVHLVTSL